jgi:hypothetical protein
VSSFSVFIRAKRRREIKRECLGKKKMRDGNTKKERARGRKEERDEVDPRKGESKRGRETSFFFPALAFFFPITLERARASIYSLALCSLSISLSTKKESKTKKKEKERKRRGKILED